MASTVLFNLERRPCYVNGKRAMFHFWYQDSRVVPPSVLTGGHKGGVVAGALGIVEFEDGTVDCTEPWKIKFADGGRFEEYAFIPEEGLNKRGEQNV